MVDIIVPVYQGFEQVRRCLRSVLTHTQRTPFELVVINDASPEEGLVAYLEDLAASGDITLVNRPVNGGFAHAVHTGMACHPTRDVVLLHSDTEVHGNWLDRLHRCAYREPKVGTVTPFSNCASIASYPQFCQDNALPKDMALAALDKFFQQENAGQSIEMPTAVDFCMYIRRVCLDEVGYFDSAMFPTGQECANDFCMRAQASGYKHLLCGDVWVYHQGNGAVGEAKGALKTGAEEKLRHRYPSFFRLIAEYIDRDPARPMRYRIDAARLRSGKHPKLLFITHHLGGGTERCVRDMAQLLEGRAEVLVLRPLEDGGLVLNWEKRGEAFRVFFRREKGLDELLACLKSLGIDRIHIHHLLGHPPGIVGLPRRLGLPYDVTLHDYFAICPQFNLTSADGRYCGEPGPEGCRACLDKRPSPWGLDIQAWRELFGGLLSRAERVFAPSRDVLERFRRYLPDAPYQLFPHLEPRKACILVLGRLSRAKGLERLVACAEDAERRGLPLHFHVLGASLETPFWEEGLPLSFHGDYRDADLPVLVGLARPDAFLFPALGPETYSYTLSAAMETGLPIVAPPLGAFAERLSAYPGACLIEDPSPRKINDRLMEIAEGLKTDFAEPLEDYLAPVRKSHAPLSPWEPTSAHLYETPSPPSVTSLSRDALVELLRELMDKPPGVPIHEEDIRALKSRGEARIEALEKALEESQMRLSELSLEIGRLHEVLEDKEREKRAILASTSWRITAPLRWAILSWRRFRSCQTVKIGGRL